MELRMIRGGLYAVQNRHEDIEYIQMIQVRVEKPWNFERIWRVTKNLKDRTEIKNAKTFPSLKTALRSLPYEFENYPGPNRVLVGLHE